jgi:hypothetical protein
LSGFTTPGPYSSGGAGNEDGFGSFNQTIDSFDGFTHTSTEIVVPLTNNSGTWADVASVLTPNASGWQVGAHIFVCGGATAGPPGSCNDYATTTGFAVGDPVGNPVPLPGALPLFATGLGGVLGLLGWRRKRKLVAIPV